MSAVRSKLEAARRLQQDGNTSALQVGTSTTFQPPTAAEKAKFRVPPQSTVSGKLPNTRQQADATPTSIHEAIACMLADNENMRQGWMKATVIMHVVTFAACLYLVIAQALTPFTDEAAYLAPLAKRMQSFEIVLSFIMLAFASLAMGLSVVLRTNTLAYMSVLPGCVPTSVFLAVWFQHNLWHEWQFLWIPAAFPFAFGMHLFLIYVFDTIRKDISGLRDKYKGQ